MLFFLIQSKEGGRENKELWPFLFFSFLRLPLLALTLALDRERERGRGLKEGWGNRKKRGVRKEGVFYGMGWDLFFGLLTLAW